MGERAFDQIRDVRRIGGFHKASLR
jgi:hypothetical protein